MVQIVCRIQNLSGCVFQMRETTRQIRSSALIFVWQPPAYWVIILAQVWGNLFLIKIEKVSLHVWRNSWTKCQKYNEKTRLGYTRNNGVPNNFETQTRILAKCFDMRLAASSLDCRARSS